MIEIALEEVTKQIRKKKNCGEINWNSSSLALHKSQSILNFLNYPCILNDILINIMKVVAIETNTKFLYSFHES